TADPLAAALDGIERLAAARHHAGIDTHEGQRANKRIAHNLEGKPGERLVVRAAAHRSLVRAHLDAVDRRDVGRRRQVVDDRVEERLYPLVFKGRAAQHRDKGGADRAFANAAFEGLLARFLAAEISL